MKRPEGKSRRARGSGTIFYHEGRKRWIGEVTWYDESGKRQRKRWYKQTEKEMVLLVNDRLYELRHQLPLTVPSPPATALQPPPSLTPPQTFGAYVQEWLRTVVPLVRSGTQDTYRSWTYQHLLPALGDYPLQALTHSKIQSFITTLKDKQLAPRTIRVIYRLLGTILNRVVADGLLPQNPARAIKLPAVSRPAANPLEHSEAMQLLKVAKGSKWEAWLVVALLLGLREAELRGLCWRGITLTGVTSLTVEHQVSSSGGGEQELAELKTASSLRTISPLPERVVKILLAHQHQQIAQYRAVGLPWSEKGYVFATEDGKPLNRDHINKWYQQMLREANLAPHRIQDLRHTCATQLLDDGMNIEGVANLLGHSDSTTTLRFYSHLTRRGRNKRAAALDYLYAEDEKNGGL